MILLSALNVLALSMMKTSSLLCLKCFVLYNQVQQLKFTFVIIASKAEMEERIKREYEEPAERIVGNRKKKRESQVHI